VHTPKQLRVINVLVYSKETNSNYNMPTFLDRATNWFRPTRNHKVTVWPDLPLKPGAQVKLINKAGGYMCYHNGTLGRYDPSAGEMSGRTETPIVGTIIGTSEDRYQIELPNEPTNISWWVAGDVVATDLVPVTLRRDLFTHDQWRKLLLEYMEPRTPNQWTVHLKPTPGSSTNDLELLARFWYMFQPQFTHGNTHSPYVETYNTYHWNQTDHTFFLGYSGLRDFSYNKEEAIDAVTQFTIVSDL
jgi:hypothetical protein